VRVDARLGTERPLVRIEVVDDGGGVPAGSDGRRGFGLTSMRERAARWGGSVAVTANGEGPGTRVRAELPLPHGTTGSGQEGTA
jgi:signal transduction histidine kinase